MVKSNIQPEGPIVVAEVKVPPKKEKPYKKTCTECGSNNFYVDYNKGETVCSKCGLIQSDNMVDYEQEWRAFDLEQLGTKARSGSALTLTKHDQGLSTNVGGGAADIYRLPVSERFKYMRLRKWQTRMTTSIERNLRFAFTELKRLTSFFDLPQAVEEEAARIYREAAEKGLVRGRSVEAMIAAALFVACRKYGQPRTQEEMADAVGISKKEMGRTHRFLARQLQIRILPTKPEEYVARFASQLGISPKTQERAIKLLDEMRNRDIISGKAPIGTAVSALYAAAVLEGDCITQREISDKVGITEVTIRNRYKDIIDQLGLADEEKKAREKYGHKE